MPRPCSILARLIVGAGLGGIVPAGSAFAQEPPQDPNALVLTVRPSGYEQPNEDQARQERLLRRLEQANYSVRSICINCGDSWQHQTYAPFHPYASLGMRDVPGPEQARPSPSLDAPEAMTYPGPGGDDPALPAIAR